MTQLINEPISRFITEEIYDAKVKYPLEGYLFPATDSFYEENPSLERYIVTPYGPDKTESIIDDYQIQLE